MFRGTRDSHGSRHLGGQARKEVDVLFSWEDGSVVIKSGVKSTAQPSNELSQDRVPATER